MSESESPDCERPIQVTLTVGEHEVLLGLLTMDLDVEKLLQEAEVKNDTVEMLLSPDDLDELVGTAAFEANHTKDRKLQKQLDELCAKLEDLFV